MDTEIISGLHTCKPKNAPSVGQVKAFICEDRGNYIKLRNPDNKKGEVGAFYRVTSAEKTNYSDAHGNISFNLDLEPAEAPAPQQTAPPANGTRVHNASPAAAAPSGPGTGWPAPGGNREQKQYDSVDQHLMRSANLYVLCLGVASTVIRDAAQRKGLELSIEDQRQIATTLFIQAKDNGYISHMSDKEQKPQQRREPY